jgi:hypothetical protein
MVLKDQRVMLRTRLPSTDPFFTGRTNSKTWNGLYVNGDQS